MTKRFSSLIVAVAVVGAAGAFGCSRDPEATARKYVASGDEYASKGQFKEAAIEYGNALKATPNAADIRYKLGRAYEDAGDPVKAYVEYARAADLDPSNVDAQMRAGTLLLVAREYEAARTRAELALKAAPNHVPAHILLGNALAGLNEIAPALRQIEQAVNLDPEYAPAWTALGAVTFVGGRQKEAAAAFHKAVELAPQSVEARLALANYQWATGALEEAEQTLKTALSLDGGNAAAHRALALLYITTQRAPEAEPHFRALATNPTGQLALADYYMGVGRNRDALAILDDVEKSGEKADARAARLRRASIEYAAGNKAEAHRIVDELIKERPRYVEARTAKARMLLSDHGSAAEALMHAREAVKANAENVAAQYTLGLAALANRNVLEAERAFEAAVKQSPRAAAAQMQLAKIRLNRGQISDAVFAAEAAARERPDDVEAAVLLSQTLRAQGNLERASRELASSVQENPKSAALQIETGWLSLQRKDPAAARAAFGKALELDPSSLEARHGLVASDVFEQKFDRARTRVAEWRKTAPDDARLRVLAARVELSANNLPAAEAALMEVISTDPSQLDAYELLGRVYVGQGKTAEAIAQYRALAQRSSEAAPGARTMVGMLEDARKNRDAARAAYQQVLQQDPQAGVAANNLAWIYAEEGQFDEALRLAKIAQDALRRRPEPEDTIGWIYLRKGLATDAIAAFERARERNPRNPVYHYHLGLAYQQLGDAERARASFTRALDLEPNFAYADDARTQLAALAAPEQALK